MKDEAIVSHDTAILCEEAERTRKC